MNRAKKIILNNFNVTDRELNSVLSIMIIKFDLDDSSEDDICEMFDNILFDLLNNNNNN